MPEKLNYSPKKNKNRQSKSKIFKTVLQVLITSWKTVKTKYQKKRTWRRIMKPLDEKL
ncbi:MAG: hypothetical protein BWY29_00990 [Microgenomates group bacterium ADurb.Bin238]|nr:MAG: hypothetical protein BWY29_00990 [Microgenomates group bacterium ADurb.Bin238]